MEKAYTPAQIEVATGGLIGRRNLHDWHARDLWLTKTEVPLAGKPYSYSQANFAEVVIVAQLINLGFANEDARRAIRFRLRTAFGGDVGYADRHARRLADLPEIKTQSGYWIIFASNTDQRLVPDAVVHCQRDSEVIKTIRDEPRASFLNIGQMFKTARKILETTKS